MIDAAGSRATRGLRVGLVNAMPGPAVLSTDRQFRALLGGVRLFRYRLPEVDPPDVEPASDFRPWSSLPRDRLDAIVVTGTEPPPGELEDARCWRPLAELLASIRDSATPTWLSCLSSHAWLHLNDGLSRQRLPTKLSGVYSQDRVARHPLTERLERPAIPHSRHNDVPEVALLERGYEVLLAGRQSGWTVAVDARRGARTVLVQGHPEYEADTLLREHRRDLGRWREGLVTDPPTVPVNYLRPAAHQQLLAHAARLAAGVDEPYPFAALAAGLTQPWALTARMLMRDWLDSVKVHIDA